MKYDGVDTTEIPRRILQDELNSRDRDRESLESIYGEGNVWNTEELTRDFEVISFLAPFVFLRRKSDGKEGTCAFQHSPRFYFKWVSA